MIKTPAVIRIRRLAGGSIKDISIFAVVKPMMFCGSADRYPKARTSLSLYPNGTRVASVIDPLQHFEPQNAHHAGSDADEEV
jgi:hypothetical protein